MFTKVKITSNKMPTQLKKGGSDGLPQGTWSLLASFYHTKHLYLKRLYSENQKLNIYFWTVKFKQKAPCHWDVPTSASNQQPSTLGCLRPVLILVLAFALMHGILPISMTPRSQELPWVPLLPTSALPVASCPKYKENFTALSGQCYHNTRPTSPLVGWLVSQPVSSFCLWPLASLRQYSSLKPGHITA